MIIYPSLAYIKTKAPPKFCNSWGATRVCEQELIREKRCNMTSYIHTTSEEKMIAKISM
jgi:hypothetical protein